MLIFTFLLHYRVSSLYLYDAFSIEIADGEDRGNVPFPADIDGVD